MNFLDIPSWLFFPFKLILLVSFFIPVLLWGEQLLGVSRVQEAAAVKEELQSTEHHVETALQYLNQERGAFESQAESLSERLEMEGKHKLASTQQELLMKTKAISEEPVGHTEAAKGIDVSHYQGVVRWDHAAEAGIQFAYAKATGGTYFVDPSFHEHWHGMREAEVYRGAYHFYYAADDPRAQAKHFVATIGKLLPTDLPPMLDVEISDHTDKKALLEGTLIWLETVEKMLGRRPLLYTDPGFGDKYLNDVRLSKYPLWIADYSAKPSSLPSPWKKTGWIVWQYSHGGTVQGVPGEVDLSIFNGTLNDLKTFVVDSRSRLNKVPYAHNITGAIVP